MTVKHLTVQAPDNIKMVLKVINTLAYFDTEVIKSMTVKCLLVHAPDNIKKVVKVIKHSDLF